MLYRFSQFHYCGVIAILSLLSQALIFWLMCCFLSCQQPEVKDNNSQTIKRTTSLENKNVNKSWHFIPLANEDIHSSFYYESSDGLPKVDVMAYCYRLDIYDDTMYIFNELGTFGSEYSGFVIIKEDENANFDELDPLNIGIKIKTSELHIAGLEREVLFKSIIKELNNELSISAPSIENYECFNEGSCIIIPLSSVMRATLEGIMSKQIVIVVLYKNGLNNYNGTLLRMRP